MKGSFSRMVLVGSILTAVSACTEQPPATSTPAAAPAPAAPTTLTVLVGGGLDTTQLNAFFPAALRIRAGDTVTWKLDADQDHTVSFTTGMSPANPIPRPGGAPGELIPRGNVPVPGGGPGQNMRNPEVVWPSMAAGTPIESYKGTGFVNSGLLSKDPLAPGLPANRTFSLTFDKPGTYPYLCLVHTGTMQASIEVLPATVADVPDQAEIDARAKAERDALLALVGKANEQGRAGRSEPGPGGATMSFVRAGSSERETGEQRAQSFEFLPKDITIKAGDTVIWAVPGLAVHTVTFIPAPPPPELLVPRAQPQGPPILTINPQVARSAKPAGVFDPAQYYNSGQLGVFPPGGTSWALTFEQPGSFKYFCAIHRELGMEGSIIVQPR